MFTGIINSIGNIENLNDDLIQISTDNNSYQNLDSGTSIGIDGTCLTLRDYENDLLNFQVSVKHLIEQLLKDIKLDQKLI